VFALPFSFDHDDYVQILTDIATKLGPALGWRPRPTDHAPSGRRMPQPGCEPCRTAGGDHAAYRPRGGPRRKPNVRPAPTWQPAPGYSDAITDCASLPHAYSPGIGAPASSSTRADGSVRSPSAVPSGVGTTAIA
jgi:hypothetical protein